jgi:predicted O-methyltransferase YrrM
MVRIVVLTSPALENWKKKFNSNSDRPFFAMQDDRELAAFCELVKHNDVRTYLEIGTRFGGTFWQVGQALPANARMVSVDLPNASMFWQESKESLQKCAKALVEQGREVWLVWGDSASRSVIDEVKRLGPFDLILIDANHTEKYVEADWANYAPLARMVAFHDIAWRRPASWTGYHIDVPQFWEKIKVRYRHEEFKMEPTGQDNGIGVLWRA